MTRARTTRPGFTMIELLIYLGMSTIVVVMISSFMVDISQSAARTRNTIALQTTSRLIINRITQTVRTANSTMTVPNASTLVIPVTGGNQTYQLSGTNLNEILPNASSNALNGQESIVKGFVVTNQTIGVTIRLTLGATATTQPPVPDYTITSTIVPRQPLYQ